MKKKRKEKKRKKEREKRAPGTEAGQTTSRGLFELASLALLPVGRTPFRESQFL